MVPGQHSTLEYVLVAVSVGGRVDFLGGEGKAARKIHSLAICSSYKETQHIYVSYNPILHYISENADYLLTYRLTDLLSAGWPIKAIRNQSCTASFPYFRHVLPY